MIGRFLCWLLKCKPETFRSKTIKGFKVWVCPRCKTTYRQRKK